MEQCGIASWDKNPRSLKLGSRREECLQVLISIADGVTEKGDGGSVGLNLSIKLGNHGCPLLNRIAQLASTVVSVNSKTEVVAGCEVARVRRSDAIARRRLLKGWSLHTRKGLADYETELRGPGGGKMVVRRLNTTESRAIVFRR